MYHKSENLYIGKSTLQSCVNYRSFLSVRTESMVVISYSRCPWWCWEILLYTR